MAGGLAVNQELLAVTPLRVLQRLAQLCQKVSFWETAACSLLRVLAGFFLAVAAGVVFAALTAASPLAENLLHPLRSVIKATPAASFIILALVWFRSGGVPVFASFLMALPFIWSNVEQGIRCADKSLLEAARLYRFGFWKTIRRVYAPMVLPYFFSALATGFGLAWKAGVAAEVIGNTRRSIGGEIYNAKLYLETADLFAWTVVVILLSVALEKLLVGGLGRLSGVGGRIPPAERRGG